MLPAQIVLEVNILLCDHLDAQSLDVQDQTHRHQHLFRSVIAGSTNPLLPRHLAPPRFPLPLSIQSLASAQIPSTVCRLAGWGSSSAG